MNPEIKQDYPDIPKYINRNPHKPSLILMQVDGYVRSNNH